ncbi:MAG: twin-arginine translocase subunit TatC [Saprospiraceae bacterium]|nr:twin-arginine translocase subunit TatC [Saprospiraceae bacterium]
MSGLLKKIVSGAKLSKDDSKEMGFLDHLEELRWHVIRAGIAVIAISSVALMFQNEIFEYVIYAPKKPSFITYRLFCALSEATCIHPPELQLITREMGEQFFMGITVSLYIGLIVAFPYIFYEFWKFIKPGLYEGELKIANRLIAATSFLFILGVCFGYYVIAPFAITFLGSYTVGTEAINSPTLSSYVNYMTMFTIPVGLSFELPIVVYFLAKIGIIGPEIMKKFRKEAFLIIFIVAAVITPPDALTQILVGVPMYVLYEISISVAARVVRDAKREEQKQID